jgi:signal transduction histidine kinase
MNFFKNSIIILSLSFLTFPLIQSELSSQELSREELIAAYLIRLSESVAWQDEENISKFNVLVLSSNSKLVRRLKQISPEVKIHEKHVEFKFALKYYPGDYQIIFIDKDHTLENINIYDKIMGQNILLMTLNAPSGMSYLINLVEENTIKGNTIRFKTSAQHFLLNGFQISDELVRLGGDIQEYADMFKKLQGLMNKMEEDQKEMKENIKQLKKQELEFQLKLKNLRTKEAKYENQIKTQEILFKNQKDSLNKKQIELENKQENLILLQIKIQSREEDLKRKNDEIIGKNVEIEKKNEILNRKSSQVDSLGSEIALQSSELDKSQETISSQQQLIFIIALILILVIMLLYFISKINKNRKIAHKALEARKVELEETLKALNKTQKQLIISEKMSSLGRLTAGISHEINNPVNFISVGIQALKLDYEEVLILLNYIQSLENQDIKEENIQKLKEIIRTTDLEFVLDDVDSLFKSIQNGIDRTVQIISGLSAFSRTEGIEPKFGKKNYKKFDIHIGLDQTLTILQSKYKDNIEIIKEYGDIPNIYCNSGEFNQVFLNILHNAIQAIKGEGQIRIKTSSLNKHFVSLLFEDTGMGMSKEVKEKVFDPFYTTKTIGEGTGLGMSIVYGIIESHGAGIKVESEEGKGTKFILKLRINPE